MSTAAATPELTPPAYLRSLVEYFRREDADVWNWFASHQAEEEHLAAIRLDLLKSAYRIEPADQADLYKLAEQAAGAIGVTDPVTLYQAQGTQMLNASLAYLPGEVHLILHGPVATTLSQQELLAVLGHELAHYRLLHDWQGEFSVCQELLRALSLEDQADPASAASLRLYSLHTEIFCDRGALQACQDLPATVTALVKLETGVAQVRAESYLQQAAEIMSKGQVRAAGVTHPESYLRARALQLWHEKQAASETEINGWLHGALSLDELDLLGQEQVAALTRRLLDVLLAPTWFQTDAVLAHARMFFADYAPPGKKHTDEPLAAELATEDQSLRDYYCYVLLDFVTADADLGELPLAAALQLAGPAGLADRLIELAMQELRLKKKQLEDLQQKGEKLLAEAESKPKAAK